MGDKVQAIADLLRDQGRSLAVAESLTSGAVASRLGAGPGAADWFRDGDRRLRRVGQVRPARGHAPKPLVTERCARGLAEGVARLLKADVALGVTGVGGPEPDEGKPAGTVVMAVTAGGAETCRTFRFPGDPEDVIAATVERAVAMLAEASARAFG